MDAFLLPGMPNSLLEMLFVLVVLSLYFVATLLGPVVLAGVVAAVLLKVIGPVAPSRSRRSRPRPSRTQKPAEPLPWDQILGEGPPAPPSAPASAEPHASRGFQWLADEGLPWLTQPGAAGAGV